MNVFYNNPGCCDEGEQGSCCGGSCC